MTPSKKLLTRLRDELDVAKRAQRRSTWIGAVMVMFIVSYFQFAYGRIAPLADPIALAEVSVSVTTDYSNVLIEGMAETILAGRVENTSLFYDMVEDSVGALRQGVEEDIAAADREMGLQIDAWLGDYFTKVVRENPQLRLAASDKAVLRDDALTGMSAQFSSDLEAMFSDSGLDTDMAGAATLLSSFADRLNRYNDPRVRLRGDEAEEKAFIYAWVQLVAPGFEAPVDPLQLNQE
jgi:hypothetical protein